MTEDNGMDIDLNNMTLDEAADYLDTLAEDSCWPPEEMDLKADLYGTAAYVKDRRAAEPLETLEKDQAYQDAVFYLDAHKANHMLED